MGFKVQDFVSGFDAMRHAFFHPLSFCFLFFS